MMDKIPIKTLLDHAKQPFIPYTTAKSVMWDGTDKTLYDVVMEGVPMPEIKTEYLSTYLLADNNNNNPLILEDTPKGIYFVPYGGSSNRFRLYYKWYASDSYVSTLYLADGSFTKYADGLDTDDYGLMFKYMDTSGTEHLCEGVRNFRTGSSLVLANQGRNITAQHIYEQLPVAYAGLNPTANNQFVHKGYVDSAITNALASFTPTVDLSNYYTKEEIDTELGERDTALNADIMVAINAAGRAEMEVQNKQNKITYGTGDPSGGSNGDVYLKYTA